MGSRLFRWGKPNTSMVNAWWWLVLALLFVGFAGLSYWLAKRSLLQEQEQLANSLAQKMLAPMVLNDPNYAQHVLDFLRDHPSVVSASLLDANGGVVAAYDPNGASNEFALAQLDDGRSRFERSELMVMSPVSVGSQVLGNVHLRVDTTPSLSDALSSVTIFFGLLAMALFWFQSQGINLRIAPKEEADLDDADNPLRLRAPRAWSPPDHALHEALAEAGIHMRYVPITDLSQGSLHGIEAVIHWDRSGALPVHVSPAEFIGLAERNDLVLPFEDWALKTAFSQVGNWHRHHGTLKLNFNISAKQFNTPTFPARIRALCAEFGLPHQAVALEIHEGMLLHMSPQQLRNFEVFDSMGLALTIDGFGSTAQSHTLLRQWSLAGAKFDKRLMAQTADANVLSARMQELARVALVRRIPIAAEGLSSLAQERAMKLMGCRLGQGMGSYQSLSTNTLNTILCKDPEQLGQAVVQPWRSSPDSGAVAV